MSNTSVFAAATSTIHADLIIVALKRIGIPTSGISILYPSFSCPDTVLYWVDGAARLTLSPAGQTVTVSGPLRFSVDRQRAQFEFPPLIDSLRSLGLNEEQSRGYESALLEDRVVVCVEATDESELALIFHILHHIGAEKIVITESVRTQDLSRRRREQPSHAVEKASLSLSAA